MAVDHDMAASSGTIISGEAGWDVTALRAACQLLVRSMPGPLRRIRLEGTAPRAGGAIAVLRLARRVAEEYHLRVYLTLHAHTMIVTFVCPVAGHSKDRVTSD